MANRDTELRYVGIYDELEVPIPEEDREFEEPRHAYVKRGETVKVSKTHAKGLVAGGDFEPVKKGGDKQ